MISVDSLALLASLVDSLRKPSPIFSESDRVCSPDEKLSMVNGGCLSATVASAAASLLTSTTTASSTTNGVSGTPLASPDSVRDQLQQQLILQQQQQQQMLYNGSVLASSSRKPCDRRRYKTELCHKFLLNPNRTCKYGTKCQYAHGVEELRTPSRPPKYKTEKCRAFHVTGVCPYGIRCHFIHDESPEKLTEIHQQKNTSLGGCGVNCGGGVNGGCLSNSCEQQLIDPVIPDFLTSALRSFNMVDQSSLTGCLLSGGDQGSERHIDGLRNLCRFV